MSKGKRRHRKKPGAQGDCARPDVDGAGSDSTPASGSTRDESGLTRREQNVLIGKAIRHNFPLDAEGFAQAVETTKRNMGHEDGRTSNGAVKNWIEMVRRQDGLHEHDEQADLAKQLIEAMNELRGANPSGQQTGGSVPAAAGEQPADSGAAAA